MLLDAALRKREEDILVRFSQFIIERNEAALKNLLPEIQKLADSEKGPLGFLPAKAFEEALQRKRIIAATVQVNGESIFAGYLLHSGVFPNAKIQQIATTAIYRQSGAASALMKALITELEQSGFLFVRADIASNLPTALKFYAKHGFELVLERSGGKSRGRTILVHSRTLDTDSLFSLKPSIADTHTKLAIRKRGSREVPVFAFDLNIFFDLVRQRDQSEKARRLFGEALGHTIRLAVADEFVTELRNTSSVITADPVLQMAYQLPRLPKVNSQELEKLAAQIHELVFVQSMTKGAQRSQAKSDAKHLAHATLAHASAFITRDGAVLNARNELLQRFGIDIATVEEVLDLLPKEPLASNATELHGDGFEPGPISVTEYANYLSDVKIQVPPNFEFAVTDLPSNFLVRQAIRCDGRVVAVGALILPKGVEPVARMLVHVRNEHHGAELFADYLLDLLIRAACENAPIAVELAYVQGQSPLNKIAISRGFGRVQNATTFSKSRSRKNLSQMSQL